MEKIFKEFQITGDEEQLDKLLTRCSDEILPGLLRETLEKLVYVTEPVIYDDGQKPSPLAEFLQKVHPEYAKPWMSSICKLFENYENISEKWVKGLSLVLGILREPWGKKAPELLNKAANDDRLSKDIREFIRRQKNLFNREKFNRGHHRSSLRRVADSRNSLFKTHQMVMKPSKRQNT